MFFTLDSSSTVEGAILKKIVYFYWVYKVNTDIQMSPMHLVYINVVKMIIFFTLKSITKIANSSQE